MAEQLARICGRVVGVDGLPVEGALTRVGIPIVPRTRADAPHDEIMAGVERTATTEDGGRFEIEFGAAPDGAVDVLVWAEKGDRVSTDHELQLAPGPVDVPDLVLGEAILPTFQLADRSGAPVAGATCLLRADRRRGRRAPRRRLRDPLRSAEYLLRDMSDEQGVLRFPPIPRRRHWQLRLEGGHPAGPIQSWIVPIEELRSGEPSLICYLWGLRVRGRLVGPDGEPRPGLHVRAARPWDPMPRKDRGDRLSGPDGSFCVTGIPSEGGTLLIDLRPKSGRPFGGPPTIPWRITGTRGGEGEELDMGEVRLPPPGSISGMVVAGSRPVVGAILKARRAGEGGIGANARSDQDGQFRFDDLPPGRYTLWAGDRSSRRQGSVRNVATGSEGIVLRLRGSCSTEGGGSGRSPE